MKRVLLVNTNTLQAPYPVPPLGLCLVAASLEGRYEVRIYDGCVRGAGEPLRAVVEEFSPDYVGLGIRNVDDTTMDGGAFFGDAVVDDFVRPLRGWTQAPIILGGSGFTILPREFMRESGADYGIVGEGEASLLALLQALDGGSDPATVQGVLCRGGTEYRAPSPVDVARMPFSRVDQRLDYGPYRDRGAYPIQTKRGCAHQCAYCSYPGLEGRTFRSRPPAEVVDELQEARERLGNITFEFVDSTFNDPPGHAEAICGEIARRGLQVRLRTMGINPAQVSDLLLERMAAAGFAQIDITPDAASPRVLKALRKNFRLEDLHRTASLVRKHRMPTMWFFLLGGPAESEETLAETFAFIDEHVDPEDMAHISEGLRIYPGTELHEIAVRDGVLSSSDSLYAPAFYVSPELGRERLREWVARAVETRPNSVPSRDSTPSPAMMREAGRLRVEQGLTEPMFRTLLRLRRQGVR